MFKAVVWDLETTDLTTFMGKLIVASFLDMTTGRVETRTINDYEGKKQDVRERRLLGWTLDQIEAADVLIGHNTKAFDCNFLRGRIEALEMKRRLPKRQHLDTYLIARYAFKGKPQGYSMENLADFFRLSEQKDKPSKHEWADSRILDPEAITRIARRCESDVRVNAALWLRLRPYYHEWRGS